MEGLGAHWNRVYGTRASEAVSWYEAVPSVSLQLLDRAGLSAST